MQSTLSGTPENIPLDADCAIRELAWEYGKNLLPERGSFKSLFDAMQLSFCNVTAPKIGDAYIPPLLETPPATGHRLLYVSTAGDDALADGSATSPFATLERAVAAAGSHQPTRATILVRGGDYHLAAPLQLSAAHNGLTMMNFQGENVRVSAGVAFTVPKSAWSPYKQHVRWDGFEGVNNVFGQVRTPGTGAEGISFVGEFLNASACAAAVQQSTGFTAWTYHEPSFGGGFAKQCFGRTDGAWAPVPQAHVTSGVHVKQNVWVADLSHVFDDADAALPDGIPGLRINGRRAIRAKYPNGDPEQSGNFLRGASQGMGGGDYVKGWIPLAARTPWVPPARKPDAREIVITAKDWPSVEWPMSEAGGSTWTGEGDWGEYHLGLGGYCDDLEPPFGYWCAMHPPRGQCWNQTTNIGSGCVQTHMSPDGMVLSRAAGYAHPEDAVVQSWRGGGRWFTQQWQVTHYVAQNHTLMFDRRTGMQGGEGMTDSGQWWIENVLEECDDAREYYYDRRTHKLYYNPNATSDGPTGDERWVATQQRVLININGSMQRPVVNVTIAGLSFADTRYTYLDPHGMPSGGDWALQRSGAITAEGTERLNITHNEFVNIDGVGISLNGYHRNATITRNDFSLVGDSAMAAWGHTGSCLNENCTQKLPYKVGPDARGGEQPHGTLVARNLVREIGLWQKQSSFWFQATTAATRLVENVHFNGPRAGVNFNDGMGGGDELVGNLIANCVRESGDHGPFNSWVRDPPSPRHLPSPPHAPPHAFPRLLTPSQDRVPYITTLRTGKPSIVPAWRELHRNFIIATYASQEAIDNDDGSSFYHTHDNFFVYAARGLKSDFGGHDNRHERNVYAFVGGCWENGNADHFVNNTCIANSPAGGFGSDCTKGPLMVVSGNTIYNEDGTLNGTKLCDTTNHIAGKWPAADDIVKLGRAVLGFSASGA